ncbi:hypothetical protein [Arthrospiribacter ruber]|uniref:Uncharacterized protein n=1 Tax=Arthrospiribacter ruber TaxID=2487934 RepID=A0A951J1J4_9BACT|nr:hypothetical protein [Arthrospiribacter ruber]MBW3469083.1 hypothetical protein [Arthrospiribacter ruber]
MDYYLRTTSKEAFIQDLQKLGIEIELDNYYQDENLIIDWIGLIPNPVEVDSEGNVIGEITYKDGQHVNIRSKQELDVSLFENTVDVYPSVPFRMFS